ncbi:hypothetical protein RCH09_001367 [Actimicrobium sp. GrIS 1.19]|uniref:protein YgfX n=1 Tax=Actimicrobium sp. GrIS 1.19 TaxID=3071708 RepID=UPI002E079E6B|nr:hypothetical protein [Actimicrobium sp. GrIS 1.19]
MSIAVSVVVRRSGTLGVLCLVMAVVAAIVTGLLASGLLCQQNTWARLLGAAFSVAASVALGMKVAKKNATYWIDISGLGQIRLSSSDTGRRSEVLLAADAENCLEIASGSLITPSLLFLRLKNKTGLIHTLLIFPDSVSQQGFRCLLVACRWIAAQNTRQTREIVGEYASTNELSTLQPVNTLVRVRVEKK